MQVPEDEPMDYAVPPQPAKGTVVSVHTAGCGVQIETCQVFGGLEAAGA